MMRTVLLEIKILKLMKGLNLRKNSSKEGKLSKLSSLKRKNRARRKSWLLRPFHREALTTHRSTLKVRREGPRSLCQSLLPSTLFLGTSLRWFRQEEAMLQILDGAKRSSRQLPTSIVWTTRWRTSIHFSHQAQWALAMQGLHCTIKDLSYKKHPTSLDLKWPAREDPATLILNLSQLKMIKKKGILILIQLPSTTMGLILHSIRVEATRYHRRYTYLITSS